MTPETLQLARNLRNSVRNGRRKQNGWGWLKRLRLRSYLDVRPSWGWVEQLLSRSYCDSISCVTAAPDNLPDTVDALRAALEAERLARREAEARASGAEAMIAHLKLLIAKLKRSKYGASSERGRKLIDQLEFELGELVAAASEDATKAEKAADKEGRTRRPAQPAPRPPGPRPAAGPPAARAGRPAVADRLPVLRRQ